MERDIAHAFFFDPFDQSVAIATKQNFRTPCLAQYQTLFSRKKSGSGSAMIGSQLARSILCLVAIPTPLKTF